jgi:hypothetical protein
MKEKVFPSAYSYIDGDSSAKGYQHWTASLEPKEYELAIIQRQVPEAVEPVCLPVSCSRGMGSHGFYDRAAP